MIHPLHGSYKKMQPFFKDFARTTLDFQELPTRNITSAPPLFSPPPPPPPHFLFSLEPLFALYFTCCTPYGHFIFSPNRIYNSIPSRSLFYSSASLHCRHFHWARESALLKLPKRGGNGASQVHHGIIPD